MNMNNDGTLPLILIPHTLTIAEDRKSSYYILIHYLVSSNAGLDSSIRTNPGEARERPAFSSHFFFVFCMTTWQGVPVAWLDISPNLSIDRFAE